MKLGSVAFPGAVLAIGLVYEGMALKMPLGKLSYPGPGYYPAIVGAFVIVMALGCLLQEVLPRRSVAPSAGGAPPKPPAGERDVRKTFQLTALMIGYILALKPVGFPIAICVFLGVAIRIFGFRRWLPTLAMSVVIAGVSYVSFVLWLKVQLPMGLLEQVLG